MSQPQVIAIDGPGASGKDTVGRMLAARLGYVFIDTGGMYRAITWLAMQKGVDPNDAESVVRLSQEARIEVTQTQGEPRKSVIKVNGQDVSDLLHTPAVDAVVSLVSKVRGVREAMVAQQQAMAEKGRVVMAGRDIGTKVLPDAPLKVYLDASVEERARRRFLEQRGKGESQEFYEVLALLKERDRLDMERSESPLRPADDAMVINTDGLAPEQVVDLVLERAGLRC